MFLGADDTDPGKRHYLFVRVIDRAKWESLRSRGKWRYIALNGIFGRGVPMGIAVAIAVEIALGHKLPDTIGTASFIGRLLLACAVFSLGGCATAYTNWSSFERRFSQTR